MGLQTDTVKNFEKINSLIDSSRFNEAFLLLKNKWINLPGSSKYLNYLKEKESGYKYLLDYIAEGHSDPNLEQVISRLKDDLHSNNELLLRELTLKDSSDIYSSTRRMFSHRQVSLSSLLDDLRQTINETFSNAPDEARRVVTLTIWTKIKEVFNFVWTISPDDLEDLETLSALFDDSFWPEYFKSLLISAIILGNLSYFNPSTLELLLSVMETEESTDLKARAAVGATLLSLIQSKRVSENINIKSHWLLFRENEELRKLVDDAIFSIIQTCDTKRIDNKMREEVIPGLMKINPEILNKFKNINSDSEDFLSDANPHWEEFLENSEIGDKLKEINDLQMEGADVMVTAFSNLKSFPFFNDLAAWFLPFTAGFYEFADISFISDDNGVLRMTSVMCDSDIHSFLLSLSSMPKDKRDLMLSNMQARMKEASEAMADAVAGPIEKNPATIMRHVLQDLYRFFKFYRKRNDFRDPFSNPVAINQFQPAVSILDLKPEKLRLVAEFYFKNKYYDEASGMFELVDSLDKDDFSLWEKIGYSHDRMHRYDKAVEWYQKSEIVNPENKWLVKKLALALKNGGKPEKALKYYKKALTAEPENFHLLMSYGESLLSSGQTEEALKQFYHALYLKPDKIAPQRAVAWTELLNHNPEKALEIYKKLISENSADQNDRLNGAHAALAMDRFKEAVDLYNGFVNNSPDKDIKNLVLALRDDNETLKKLNIKTSDLRLIVDIIRYKNQFIS